jgi:hypothetical protein
MPAHVSRGAVYALALHILAIGFLGATVRDFSAVTMQLNPGAGLKTNKLDSGI